MCVVILRRWTSWWGLKVKNRETRKKRGKMLSVRPFVSWTLKDDSHGNVIRKLLPSFLRVKGWKSKEGCVIKRWRGSLAFISCVSCTFHIFFCYCSPSKSATKSARPWQKRWKRQKRAGVVDRGQLWDVVGGAFYFLDETILQ